jgi:F-type H+-transporting ATPase subunit b
MRPVGIAPVSWPGFPAHIAPCGDTVRSIRLRHPDLDDAPDIPARRTYASQIFWVLIFFGFVFFVIGKGMVPKVMETVAARDGQIAADLAFAEAARRAAEGAEASWQPAASSAPTPTR